MNEQKRALRDYIRQQKTLHLADASIMSDRIMEKLEADSDFIRAQTVLLYFSLGDEVNTHDFIAKHGKDKCILLPVVTGDTLELRIYDGDMKQGAFGIMEPTGQKFSTFGQIDVAVIPGMAFDQKGNRMGRGKGYYDKLLPALPHAIKIGICFPFQLVEEVPVEEYDVPMDKVISL